MQYNRKLTNQIRTSLDDWLPPKIRECRLFKYAVQFWLGDRALPDFKYRAYQMTDSEFWQAYSDLGGEYSGRSADTTPDQEDWIVRMVGGGCKCLLEIGPGNGHLTRRMSAVAQTVTVVDLVPRQLEGYLAGSVEHLPLPDKSVEVTVLSHVIEHSRSLTRAFLELARVTRDRVIIVAPKQRFYRFTFDYHLHFFYSLDHLASHIPCGRATGQEIDGDLCLVWDVSALAEAA